VILADEAALPAARHLKYAVELLVLVLAGRPLDELRFR
jgi:hypothetical protein